MMPLNAGIFVMRVTSRMIESLLRLWMMRPWWCVRAQKEQAPKHPRWLVTENCTGSSAGMDCVYEGCASRENGSS